MHIHHIGKQNSVLNQFIYELRDTGIQKDSMRFRRNIERIGEILSYELSKTLEYSSREVKTPLGTKTVSIPRNELVLCSVLRAGLPLHLPATIKAHNPKADVGLVPIISSGK